MICQAAIVVELATSKPASIRSLARTPQWAYAHRVCLPKKHARALARGHFVVIVDGKPVALSLKPIRRP